MANKQLLAEAIALLNSMSTNSVQFEDNPILDTDSYKPSHFLQYPDDTAHIVSYGEARGTASDGVVIPFGFNYFVQRYLLGRRITMDHIDQAEKLFAVHGVPFNRDGFERIVNVHKGYWPVHILSVAEGKPIPRGTPLFTMYNTDPELPWVTSYLETAILRAYWYGTTVATLSYEMKQIIKAAMEKSCNDLTKLPFMLHDFGARGVSSLESAAIGGAAHLMNFVGSDTLPALPFLQQYYGGADDSYAACYGLSIPAAEHSTMTSWGGPSFEAEAYENMLNKFGKKGGIYAVVSDSYDIYYAVEHIWGEELRQQVIDSGATLVIRPDSGEPTEVLPRLLRILEEKFGATLNEKGYKVIDHNVRLIQGDGITRTSLPTIIQSVLDAGYSLDNMAFGMGGGLLQHVNRDDLRFAMKACLRISKGGQTYGIGKDPITDPGKKSKQGFPLTVRNSQGGYGWLDMQGRLKFVKKGWEDKDVPWTRGFLLDAYEDYTVGENGEKSAMEMTYYRYGDYVRYLEGALTVASIRENTGLWMDSELLSGIPYRK